MSRPNEVRVIISDNVKCTNNEDERLLTATARLSNDPKREGDKINWMVQWFEAGQNEPEERRTTKKVSNPRWSDTVIIKDWSDRNPHGTLIKGATAKIKVNRNDSKYWVCWMWPGEEYTTNGTEIGGPPDLNIGPILNTDLDESLTGIRWDDDYDIGEVFANGVFEIKNQRLGDQLGVPFYRARYEYLWSGRENVTNISDLDPEDEIYWYTIEASSKQFNTEKESCPNDTTETNAKLTITCKDYVGEELTARWSKCSESTKTYQWQQRRAGVWKDVTGGIKSTYTPNFAGTYRCTGKCGTGRAVSDNCFIDERENNAPEPTPTPSCPIIKLDWPGAPNFPLYVPTSRNYTLGEFPTDYHWITRGNEAVIQRGNRMSSTQFKLDYANITDKEAMDFITHFNTFAGTSNLFELTHTNGKEGPFEGLDVITGGQGKGLWLKGLWRYKEAPKVTGIRPGISSVRIELIRVQGPLASADGSETPWPNYPDFPSFAPSSRVFTVGDWNVERFKGPDNIEVGRVTSPQRDSILDLTYQAQPDMDMSAFFRHYVACRGYKKKFTLQRTTPTKGPFVGFQAVTPSAGCKQWYEDGKWCYAAPPTITSVRKGYSTVRIKLRCPFTAIQLIKE